MDQELRVQQLDRIKQGKQYSEMQIVYRDRNQKLPVYDIPLDVLVFNKHNGRIASRVKSFEKQNRELDPSKAEDRKVIETFLYDSHAARNKQTIEDLRKNQQLRFGIVTKDGVIIDGNRRAMLLGRIAAQDNKSPGYFKAVILDDRIADVPREIMRLETTYQLGEDEKLGYNAIEKYLKVKDLLANKFNHAEIADMMSATEGEVKEIEGIMKLMDRYLNLLGYDEIYTRLDGTEGIFVDLHQYLSRYRKGNGLADWNFDQDADLADLEVIYFDLIRARYSNEGKDYRDIGKPSKEGSFFCKGAVWKEFRDHHFKHIEPITQAEKSIDEIKKENPGKDLDELLKQRDLDWADKVNDKIKENIGLSKRRLEDVNETNAPLKLLNRALGTLQAINTEVESFWRDEEVEAAVSAINTLTYELKKAIKNHRKAA